MNAVLATRISQAKKKLENAKSNAWISCLKELTETNVQSVSLSGENHHGLDFTNGSSVEENINMVIDEPIYDFDQEVSMNNDSTFIEAVEDVENASSKLVYDFSTPAPVPGYDDAKNLEFMKIVKEFGISQKAHISLAKHFNNILSTSNEILYRACSP
ncbi:hypothetical protein PHYBLDRAFT_163132 [Phycomyces blakesleeanus NRRL 1555(-)]|uniref:Uncharacterized protein n=1 Tax=Phycomyces blakesleeanus (strain ATCC 8743b / DSM 1359 / FGSC 10004 / NBRC 33097 / NRRL 1555) TaxID=763407 RepID=A0A162V586_PHYB8|nr:hypothetical protein PHYBLDRAFT_163132 [Phycomyces blakesleeanus NRRL 1555(-)]OAD80083.1 hypothetical protein PHYBLDRAFT_163132 [Phycomyces blakesleeanus NRRL 1555(-)]|eukprot:XP_018298123.1 hypothetical protein PHYBLDRAFT_163132 [Phycomyces blakesleeanus NRRL 1555(-)]